MIGGLKCSGVSVAQLSLACGSMDLATVFVQASDALAFRAASFAVSEAIAVSASALVSLALTAEAKAVFLLFRLLLVAQENG